MKILTYFGILSVFWNFGILSVFCIFVLKFERLSIQEELGTVLGVKTPPGVDGGSIHEEHTGSSERQNGRKMAIGISSIGLIILMGIIINDMMMMRLSEEELRGQTNAKRGLNRSVDAGDSAEVEMLADGDEEDNYE